MAGEEESCSSRPSRRIRQQYHEWECTAAPGEMTIAQADYHQRRIDAAHRRFLSALKTLAQVSKLAVPAIQFNIGVQQVNVAGAS